MGSFHEDGSGGETGCVFGCGFSRFGEGLIVMVDCLGWLTFVEAFVALEVAGEAFACFAVYLF